MPLYCLRALPVVSKRRLFSVNASMRHENPLVSACLLLASSLIPLTTRVFQGVLGLRHRCHGVKALFRSGQFPT